MKKLLPVSGVVVIAAVWVYGCAVPGGQHERTHDGHMALLKNLGSYSRRITTKSQDAQRFFDQGFILVYAFNHAEALRSFQESARLDPQSGWATGARRRLSLRTSMIPQSAPTGSSAVTKQSGKPSGTRPGDYAPDLKGVTIWLATRL